MFLRKMFAILRHSRRQELQRLLQQGVEGQAAVESLQIAKRAPRR
jgi:hypothetical protein